MSYTIVITRNIDIPLENKEAWEYLEKNRNEDSKKQAPDFLKLLKVFSQEFPCIYTLADDEVDEGIWSDGPLSENAGENLITLGIVYSAVDKALPYLIKTANKNFFVVFDEQVNRIYRPDRKLVTYEDYTDNSGESDLTLYETLDLFHSMSWHKKSFLYFPITPTNLFQIIAESNNLLLMEVTNDSENMEFDQKYGTQEEVENLLIAFFNKEKLEEDMLKGFNKVLICSPSASDKRKNQIIKIGIILVAVLFISYVLFTIIKDFFL